MDKWLVLPGACIPVGGKGWREVFQVPTTDVPYARHNQRPGRKQQDRDGAEAEARKGGIQVGRLTARPL